LRHRGDHRGIVHLVAFAALVDSSTTTATSGSSTSATGAFAGTLRCGCPGRWRPPATRARSPAPRPDASGSSANLACWSTRSTSC
jgi:hypothetical protein